MGVGTQRSKLGSGERFEIRQKLGAGGMGAVYRAFDRERKIELALKSLLKADARALYRFKREFRSLADVIHPNLVNLYELHTVGDEWFFTMELIEGIPFVSYVRPYVGTPMRDEELGTAPTAAGTVTDTSETKTTGVWKPAPKGRERVRRGTLDVTRLDRALYQLVDGVIALHRSGKLHRDLKPSNVLVENDGRVVLLDFGLTSDLASMLEEHTHDTLAVGTPLYMSPEQAADVPLTEASDWYSVGVMLYESLTGRRPFEDAGDQIYLQKQLHDPPPPRQLEDGVPERLDDLCMRLLRRDPRKRPTGDEVLRLIDRRPSRATLQLDSERESAPFVGRQAELGALRSALEDSRLGGSVAVFVSGLSGMGKTTLVRKFLREVESSTEAIVLEGRCYERESVPYKALDAVVDALTRHLLALPADELGRVLPRDIMALARLFPTLRRVPAIAEPEKRSFEPPDPQELRRRAFGALRYLLKQLAFRRPVILYVDDLQWGDADSASFLADLVYHPAPPALLMILSYRQEDEAASALIQELRFGRPTSAGGEVRDVRIEPLPTDEAVALVRELGVVSGDRQLIELLVRDANGNPLFLAELARMSALDSMAGGTGEMTLEDILRFRIASLEPNARELLEMSALVGVPADPELLVSAAGVDGEGPELASLRTENLLRSRLASDGRSMVEPYHDRVREVVRDSIDSWDRAEKHRKLAVAMERHGGADPSMLLEHWSGAGDKAKIGYYATQAAEAAVRSLAFHRAAEFYALALEHCELGRAERCAMREHYGHVLANAGRLASSADAFAAAAEDASDEEQRLELGRLELEQRLRHGDLDRGIAKAIEVLSAVDLSLPTTHRRAMMSILASRARLRLRGLSYQERQPDQIPPRTIRRLEVCWSASSALSFVEPYMGRALQMKFLRLALDTGHPLHVAQAFCLELGYLSLAGEPVRERVEELRERALDIARTAGDRRTEGIIESAGGLASFLAGRWREGVTRMKLGERMLRDSATDARWVLSVTEFFYTASLVFLGELAELGRMLPIYLREAEERGDVYTVRGLKSWRSNLSWLVADRPTQARAALDAVAVGGGFHLHHYYQLLSASQIDMYEGRGDAAWKAVNDSQRPMKRAMLTRIQTVRVEMLFLRARTALSSLGAGERAAKLAAVDDCARRLERERAGWSRALAPIVRAGRAAATGDEDRAVVELWNAVERCDEHDMALYANCARARLAALIAGDEGQRLTDEVASWMTRENVVAPEKLVQLFAPGFEPLD